MIRRPPSSPRPSPLFRDTTLFRSGVPAQPLGRRGGLCWYRRGAVVAGEDALLPKSGNGERGMAAVSSVRFLADPDVRARTPGVPGGAGKSEEHTSELQSIMRSSYAVFCLKQTIPEAQLIINE